MERPIKIELKHYMRDTGDINHYYVDVIKLSNVGVVVLPKSPQDDIVLMIDGCQVLLVNESATIQMLSNYMTFTGQVDK